MSTAPFMCLACGWADDLKLPDDKPLLDIIEDWCCTGCGQDGMTMRRINGVEDLRIRTEHDLTDHPHRFQIRPDHSRCWQTVDRATFERDLEQRIDTFSQQPGNSVGGSLHIVLSDGNIDDHHITWVEGYACGAKDDDGYVIANMLSRLNADDRQAWYDNGWRNPDSSSK